VTREAPSTWEGRPAGQRHSTQHIQTKKPMHVYCQLTKKPITLMGYSLGSTDM
jgi:hypothetical protein